MHSFKNEASKVFTLNWIKCFKIFPLFTPFISPFISSTMQSFPFSFFADKKNYHFQIITNWKMYSRVSNRSMLHPQYTPTVQLQHKSQCGLEFSCSWQQHCSEEFTPRQYGRCKLNILFKQNPNSNKQQQTCWSLFFLLLWMIVKTFSPQSGRSDEDNDEHSDDNVICTHVTH